MSLTRSTPYLAVDAAVVHRNIERMADFARNAGIGLRPHAKTHKSLDVAGFQLDAGAVGLTVATLGEAEVFARGGCRDLFVAYPLWMDSAKARRLSALLENAAMRVGVDSVEGAQRLGAALGANSGGLGVCVEVDSGHHRSGTTPEAAARVALAAAQAGLRVDGVYTFPGHGYGPGRAAAAARQEAAALATARDGLLAAGLGCAVVSGGSTPTARHAASGPVTELRPGVYVYNDAQQLESGSCAEEEIGLWAEATVVGVRGSHVVADAGSKVLGADRPDWATGFGRVAGVPEARVVALSEHHATIDWGPDSTPRPGDRVRIFPNHVCNAVNLVDDLVALEEGYDAVWTVHARGANI